MTEFSNGEMKFLGCVLLLVILATFFITRLEIERGKQGARCEIMGGAWFENEMVCLKVETIKVDV